MERKSRVFALSAGLAELPPRVLVLGCSALLASGAGAQPTTAPLNGSPLHSQWRWVLRRGPNETGLDFVNCLTEIDAARN